MKVLVLGALGFIGSSIADAYYQAGHSVAGCDNLSSNVIGWDESPAARWYTQDAADCLGLLEDHPDLVVQCANPVGAAGILPLKGRIASETMRTTSSAVEYCAMTGARLIYISSSEVYGKSGTYTESDDLRVPAALSPRIEYAAGKIVRRRVSGRRPASAASPSAPSTSPAPASSQRAASCSPPSASRP